MIFSLPEDVGISVDFGGPFRLAAVAFAVVGRHGSLGLLCLGDCCLAGCAERVCDLV